MSINENKRIKVMHVAECVGGVDRYLHSLIKYSDHEKFENIVVLSQLYNKNDYVNLADHVEIINMKHGIGMETLFGAKAVRRLIKKYNPDIVYAHSSISGAITRLAHIGLRSKCIYNPHGWSFNMLSEKQKVFIILEKIMAPFCDAIVCISEAEKKSALDKKICNQNKLNVINNGIDFEEYQNTVVKKSDINIPDESIVVGMVGRICKQKAPDVFIKMAGEINKYIENVYYVIVGDVLEGEEAEKIEIEKVAEDLGIRLTITGWVNNPLDYVKTFDVACLLSRWEGFGLVIPEYMLCEKPIVATSVDAIPYLISDHKNGLLVPCDDYVSASNAVVDIIKDESLRDRMVAQGIRDVHERFDAKRVSKEHEVLYCRELRKEI